VAGLQAAQESDDGPREVVTLADVRGGVPGSPSRPAAFQPGPRGVAWGGRWAGAGRARREEREIMDRLQQSCLGAVFDIKAIGREQTSADPLHPSPLPELPAQWHAGGVVGGPQCPLLLSCAYSPPLCPCRA